eukprot:TRINITY_DN17709_c0_g1_i1.p1 TRINITY_DN17709_c0_g1~~TRINITY_DN17709_c0_g1_i1.p1  ORF type:complete len:287 (+),score=33.24 TRINITY_DN17709_c0_g1_i1:78-938(+)
MAMVLLTAGRAKWVVLLLHFLCILRFTQAKGNLPVTVRYHIGEAVKVANIDHLERNATERNGHTVKNSAIQRIEAGCVDVDKNLCSSWGTQYCSRSPAFYYQKKPVRTYWCPKTCSACSGSTSSPPSSPPPPSRPSPPPPSRSPSRSGGGCSGNECSMNRQLLQLVNGLRAQNGVSPLCLNNKLILAAMGHSQDMAANNYFSHNSLDGSPFSARITAQGFQWTSAGENIAQGYTTVQEVFNGWANSPGHRANMLDSSFQFTGTYLSQPNNYWTQDFGGSTTEACNN